MAYRRQDPSQLTIVDKLLVPICTRRHTKTCYQHAHTQTFFEFTRLTDYALKALFKKVHTAKEQNWQT